MARKTFRSAARQAEDAEVWKAVARSVRPMHESKAFDLPDDAPAPEPKLAIEPPVPSFVEAMVTAKLPRFRAGEKAPESRPVFTPAAEPALRMDARAFGKMQRGKLAPEARIDLHGLTLSEAHPELISFVLGSHAKGLRLVLVITGKGRVEEGYMTSTRGVLRRQVPLWLRQAPLGPLILEVSEAHLRHGGGGALYVYLKRQH